MRFGLNRKGCKGRPTVRVQENDAVVAVCVVSGCREPLVPLPALGAPCDPY